VNGSILSPRSQGEKEGILALVPSLTSNKSKKGKEKEVISFRRNLKGGRGPTVKKNRRKRSEALRDALEKRRGKIRPHSGHQRDVNERRRPAYPSYNRKGRKEKKRGSYNPVTVGSAGGRGLARSTPRRQAQGPWEKGKRRGEKGKVFSPVNA